MVARRSSACVSQLSANPSVCRSQAAKEPRGWAADCGGETAGSDRTDLPGSGLRVEVLLVPGSRGVTHRCRHDLHQSSLPAWTSWRTSSRARAGPTCTWSCREVHQQGCRALGVGSTELKIVEVRDEAFDGAGGTGDRPAMLLELVPERDEHLEPVGPRHPETCRGPHPAWVGGVVPSRDGRGRLTGRGHPERLELLGHPGQKTGIDLGWDVVCWSAWMGRQDRAPEGRRGRRRGAAGAAPASRGLPGGMGRGESGSEISMQPGCPGVSGEKPPPGDLWMTGGALSG